MRFNANRNAIRNHTGSVPESGVTLIDSVLIKTILQQSQAYFFVVFINHPRIGAFQATVAIIQVCN